MPRGSARVPYPPLQGATHRTCKADFHILSCLVVRVLQHLQPKEKVFCRSWDDDLTHVSLLFVCLCCVDQETGSHAPTQMKSTACVCGHAVISNPKSPKHMSFALISVAEGFCETGKTSHEGSNPVPWSVAPRSRTSLPMRGTSNIRHRDIKTKTRLVCRCPLCQAENPGTRGAARVKTSGDDALTPSHIADGFPAHQSSSFIAPHTRPDSRAPSSSPAPPPPAPKNRTRLCSSYCRKEPHTSVHESIADWRRRTNRLSQGGHACAESQGLR